MDTAAETQAIPAIADRSRGLGFLFLSLVAVSALADFCFWRDNPRLTVGIFAVGATGIILLNRPGMRWSGRVVTLLVLICGAALESAIDLCFSNVVVLIALMFALGGETFYEPLRSGWSRWSEAAWTMVKTPGRWIMLMLEIAGHARQNGPAHAGSLRKAARVLWIVIPGLLVTTFFAVILGNGNVMLAKLENDWTAAIDNWILNLHLDFWRCFFWAFVAVIALPVLWPSPSPRHERIWTKEMPLLPEFAVAGTARLQSLVMLGLLNGLFFFVNTIDAIYLWAGRTLPAGVDPKAFVHEGVASLITAVIFSAILLAGLFQQVCRVAAWIPLRLLALLWIGQNLVLLASVFLRLKLYVDPGDLTVMRVNVIYFLALVAAGFVLLGIHVWCQRTLGWLLHSNMLATFFLFYTLQFVDTEAFVARYNVRVWENSHQAHPIDVPYLKFLGPPAYGAVETVARSGESPQARDATDYLKEERSKAQAELDRTPWASWQFRTRWSERKLLTLDMP